MGDLSKWTDRIEYHFRIVRLSLADSLIISSNWIRKDSPFWLFCAENVSFFSSALWKVFFAKITQYKAIRHLFHEFLHSNCRMGVAYHFGNNRNPSKLPNVPETSKTELTNVFTRKKGFWSSSSKIHIFGYTDPFVMRFFFL